MVSPLRHAVCALLGASTATFAPAADLPGYVKLDTREATRREALRHYAPTLAWSPWRQIGPFDNTDAARHDVVYPPELGIDLASAVTGKGGRAVAWTEISHEGWGPIDLDRYDEAGNAEAICYLYREAVAEADATMTFEMGSDDGLKVWQNGRLLVDADVPRGLNVGDHVVELPFVRGRNALLVKVTQGVGSWQFQMRPLLDPRMVARLDYQLDLDFPGSPESAHYRMLTVLEPPEIVLEVGGLDVLPDGRPIVATRRGEVWIVEGAYDEPAFEPRWRRFAAGLHEPLGAYVSDGALLVAQRGELTRLLDTDGDDVADRYECASDGWGVSGNYHEFAFGPEPDGEGRLWVTLGLGFCGSLGKSLAPWRGWAVVVHEDGAIEPMCGGLRVPNGLGRDAQGDMFATDNQGDWVGTCKLVHLERGDWHGHPGGDRWYAEAGLPAPRGEESFKAPAVWFPYGRMGQSASDILLDATGGRFGPFEGQLFVGDQMNASVMRVDLERVGGAWQGACFPFREGFACGVNRVCFGPDGSMFAGLTNRGWGSLGGRSSGLQRLRYSGDVPFEILHLRATPDGFEIEFTRPADTATAGSPASYALSSFTYKRFEEYGSPEIERRDLAIRAAAASPDGKSVRLTVSGLRRGFVHELHADGVRSAEGAPLLHPEAYYTLNVIPQAGR